MPTVLESQGIVLTLSSRRVYFSKLQVTPLRYQHPIRSLCGLQHLQQELPPCTGTVAKGLTALLPRPHSLSGKSIESIEKSSTSRSSRLSRVDCFIGQVDRFADD